MSPSLIEEYVLRSQGIICFCSCFFTRESPGRNQEGGALRRAAAVWIWDFPEDSSIGLSVPEGSDIISLFTLDEFVTRWRYWDLGSRRGSGLLVACAGRLYPVFLCLLTAMSQAVSVTCTRYHVWFHLKSATMEPGNQGCHLWNRDPRSLFPLKLFLLGIWL